MAGNSGTWGIIAGTLVGAACGLVGGLFLRTPDTLPTVDRISNEPAMQVGARPAEASASQMDLAKMRESLDDLKAMVTALQQSSRAPVYPEEPDAKKEDSTEDAPSATVTDRLRRIELGIDALRETIKEQVWVQQPPTIEQLRAAPQGTNWDAIYSFCGLFDADQEAARQSVIGKSYDEILTRFGRPTEILAKRWWYRGQREGDCTFLLDFVNGFVGDVRKRQ